MSGTSSSSNIAGVTCSFGMLSVMRSLVILLLLVAGRVAAAPLNAVIGDAGWRGTGARTEDDRIAAHLATVEAQLRRASDSP